MLLRALLGDVPSDFSVHDGTRHADLRYERGLIRNPAQRLPRCATAVGAGAINAFVFADVGIATYKADILLLLDADVRREVRTNMEKNLGIRVLTGKALEKIAADANGCTGLRAATSNACSAFAGPRRLSWRVHAER